MTDNLLPTYTPKSTTTDTGIGSFSSIEMVRDTSGEYVNIYELLARLDEMRKDIYNPGQIYALDSVIKMLRDNKGN
jgi:hypothetical protein